jgi:hypothetical protein
VEGVLSDEHSYSDHAFGVLRAPLSRRLRPEPLV